MNQRGAGAEAGLARRVAFNSLNATISKTFLENQG